MDKQKIIYFWSMKAYDKCRNKIDSALLRRRRLCLTAGGHDPPLVFRVAARIDDSPVVSARALGTVRRNRSATWTSVVEELLRRMLVIFRSFMLITQMAFGIKKKLPLQRRSPRWPGQSHRTKSA